MLCQLSAVIACCGNRRTTRARARVSSVYSTCDAGFSSSNRLSTSEKPSTSANPTHSGAKLVFHICLFCFSSTFQLRHINYVNGICQTTAPKTFHRKQIRACLFVLRSSFKQNVCLTNRWRCVYNSF